MRRVPLLLLLVSLAAFAQAQQSDLTVVKTGPETAAAGTDVTYSIAVRNLGPDDAASVTLTDTIPDGMTFVSATQNGGPAFNCAPLPAPGTGGTISCTGALADGEIANFTFVFHIDGAAEPGTTFTNIATVSSPTDFNEENDAGVAVTSTPPPPQADLSVSKSGPPSSAAGRDVTYTIVLRNGGPDAATNVTLTDTLPGTMTFVSLSQSGTMLGCTTPAIGGNGTITCTAASYPAGATTTLTLTARVPADAGSGTEFTNTAVVTSDSDPNEENNAGSTTLLVVAVDIAVLKTGPLAADAGTDISYGIAVSNSGPDFASAVTLSDVIPAGSTFVSMVRNSGPAATCSTPTPGTGGTVFCNFALGNGQAVTFTLTVRPDANTTSITNTARVTSQEFDTDPDDNESSVTTTVTPRADLSVSKSGPASVAAGADVTYTVTAANAGPSAAANVTVTDAPPPNTTFVSVTQTSGPAFTCGTSSCTIASFAANATATFQFVFRVAPSATGSIENTATVSSTTADPAAGNNTSTITTPVAASADVTVAKSGPAAATAGENVTYTVVAANNGPSDAANVSVSDPAPANTTFVSVTQTAGPAFTCGTTTCTIATLPAGGSATFQFVFRVAPSATGPIENTATISTTTPDPNGANDTSTISTPVAVSADLGVAKTGPAAAATAGENVTYTVVATNNGPSDAASVSVSDPAPANTTFVSVTQTAGPTFTCNTTTCTIATLPAGGSATFEFVFRVSPSATGTISNTATITATTSDPASANNTSTISTPLAPSADLGVAKTGPAAAVTAGENVTYTVVATNNGPSDAANVSVSDPAPANATFVSVTQTAGPTFTCNTTTCTIATLPAGGSATFQFVFRVSPSATGTVSNTATITATTSDPATANNTSTVATPVATSADVSVAKTGPDAVASGTNVTYTVTVANGGPSDASNVTLSDPAPANTTFVSVTQTSGPPFTCTTTTCSIATLVAGASATFEYVFTVNPGATGSIENTATVTSTTADPDPSDNTATTTTGLDPGTTDLSITKTANGQNFANASAVTYTIVVTNNGPAVAFGTTVTDPLPPGTTLESASASQGSCSGTTTVVCALGTLAPTATATVTLIVRLPRTPGPITNTATVTAANAESSPGNNAATTALTVTADIPAVTPAGLLLLVAVMAMVGWVAVRS